MSEYQDDLQGVPNLHFHEASVIRYAPYLNTVESAMMTVAFEIIDEGPSNRVDLARAVIFQPDDRKRFAESFASWGLRHDAIRLTVFHGPDDYHPELIKGEALREIIRAGWDFAANIAPESE